MVRNLAARAERSILVTEKAPNEPVGAIFLLDCAAWKANGSELPGDGKQLFADLQTSAGKLECELSWMSTPASRHSWLQSSRPEP